MSLILSSKPQDIERSLLAALGEAVIATDLAGAITYWNQAAERLYGWSEQEVLGLNILDVTPTAMSRDEASAIFARLLKGETWSGRFQTRRKDGSALGVHVTDYPVRDDLGHLIAIVGISRPIEVDRDIQVRSSAAAASPWRLPHARPSVRQAALALVIYAGALAVRLALDLVLPGQFPFAIFLPALAIAAVYVGPLLSAALLAAFTATGVAWATRYGTAIWPMPYSAAAVFFASGAVLILLLTLTVRARKRALAREEEISLLNSELHHRIKNLFALTTSVCVQTIRASDSLQDAARKVTGRIQAIASAQEVLAIGGEGAELARLVKDVVVPLAPNPNRIEIAGPRTILATTNATSLSLLLHELATNAVKHGAWAGNEGSVHVTWRVEGDCLHLEWRERVDLAERHTSSNAKRGFGSTLVRRALPHARVVHEVTPRGARCSIALPLEDGI